MLLYTYFLLTHLRMYHLLFTITLGFPTIKAVQNGKLLKEYSGARDVESIVTFAKTLAEKYGPLPEVVQMYNKDVFEEQCVNKSLCIVGILPHIMDSNAVERNKYITILQEASKKFLSSQWGFVWVENYQHPGELGVISYYCSLIILIIVIILTIRFIYYHDQYDYYHHQRYKTRCFKA